MYTGAIDGFGRGTAPMIAPGGRPVLVVGCPRSGTTWVGTMLGGTAGVEYRNEPDNVQNHPFVLRATRGLGPLPAFSSGDSPPRAFVAMWDVAFGRPVRRLLPGPNHVASRLNSRLSRAEHLAILDPARPPLSTKARLAWLLARRPRQPHPQRRVVKSVYVALELEWLIARYDPAVVWARRHPLDVTASFLAQPWVFPTDLVPQREAICAAWGVARALPDDRVGRAAWTTGFIMSLLRAHAAAHPATVVVDHEELCRSPHEGLRTLAARVGLSWTDADDRRVDEHDRPDDRHWVPFRVTAEQPGKWPTRLTADEQRLARDVLAAFPVAEDYAELV